MIQAKNARNESARNARSFLIDFIDMAILGQLTELNTDNIVKVDLSDDRSHDVMKIKIHYPRTFREVLDGYKAQGWQIEEKTLPSEMDETRRVPMLILTINPNNT